ncbi:conserved hypothetical protein [Methanocaldococcus sp. FS406-22]|uniref:hypothetical protein n=1 Tax=Methanocaldococcus sp. (strain FS406-22) TaxID=644281 RepID=UPI0001BF2430|nr:hypothetical protein [Methanocaldococcus sp. FS406-22]ADC68752.1 conserved hypothetical protein [Methanocaldococcus sp. FS406-22]
MKYKTLLIHIFLLIFWISLAYFLPYYLFVFKYLQNYVMINFREIGAIFVVILEIFVIINLVLLLMEVKKIIKEFL